MLLALAFTWPLVLHLDTHLTGPVGGDTGVYVWNQWVFRHELLNEHLPLFTREIFSLTRPGRPANLSLHNYTIFQDLLALPLLGTLGTVTTFNVVYLLMTVITGYATFRLVCYVTGRPLESWLAGALFSWSPYLVTRGMGHFSLVAAAPLPVFALLLLKCEERPSVRNAVALGATVCWAATTDPYYAVYCVMLACVFVAVQAIRFARDPLRCPVPRTIDVLLASVAGFALSLVIGGGWQLSILGRHVSIHGLYTPMLLLTLLALLRAAWPYRHAALSIDRTGIVRFARAAFVAVPVSALMLSPVLYAVGVRIRDDMGFESPHIRWRTSPPGVDLVSFFLPNPNHPLAPDSIRAWLTPRPDGYLENVASVPLVALMVIAGAIGAGWRPSRIWVAITVTFGLLALGPFVHVAGFNTHVPGPWALARYVPLIGLARTPARLSIVVVLGVSVIFAMALTHLGHRWPQQRRMLLACVAVAMFFELLPAPRVLYSASVPAFYARISEDPRDVTLLELPVGVRDGTSSIGNFTARSQFFQTAHGKPLIGGYLSRVSRRRIAEVREDALLDALITLSEGGTLDPAREAALVQRGPDFLRRGHIGYVVIDNERTPPALRDFAVRALHLQHVAAEDSYDLFVPASIAE